jgi:hypothetical protein
VAGNTEALAVNETVMPTGPIGSLTPCKSPRNVRRTKYSFGVVIQQIMLGIAERSTGDSNPSKKCGRDGGKNRRDTTSSGDMGET